MKIKDKLSFGVSLLALALSVVTSVHDWVVGSRAAARKQQSDIYNAYQLGQSVAILYAYEKANGSGTPPSDPQTDAKIAGFQIPLWTFKAQGYSEYFRLTAERFQEFVRQMKGSESSKVYEAFEELNPNIQVVSDHKAVAAYDLGWQMMLFGIESAANTDTKIVADYPAVRDQLNGDLKEIGVRYSFPSKISDSTEFVAAVKAARKTLDKLQP